MDSASSITRNARNLYIDGKWVPPSSEATIEVRDSATEDVYLTVAAAQKMDVDRAVAAAKRAFESGPWARMSPMERAPVLRKIAEGWSRRSESAAQAWTAESGVLLSVARYIAKWCADPFDFYAGLGQTFAWESKHVSADGLPSFLVREPVGVVAAIIPWNSPGTILGYKVAPALIAGCSVIIKASPEAPGLAYLFAELCEEAGVPAGVVNVLTADREVSELLVRHPAVDKVSFTGSTPAGRKIASICGERIARCTLELGGKSPAIVLDDYDVGQAAASIVAYAPFLTGQVCSSLTRIIVNRRRHDALVEALSHSFGALKVDDPSDPTTQMGPLASAAQRGRVEHYIAKGKADGARLALGGGRPAHLPRGYYIEPTVFAGVDNSWTIAREEIFGPVLSVIPVDNDEEAIRVANDTIYGLNAAVFTNDVDRAYQIGRRLRSGTVGHNAFKSDFTIAFGGFKQSGLGREGGVEGLLPYLESKTLILAREPTRTQTSN